MQYGFGIDLGGTTVKMALFDREGEPPLQVGNSHGHPGRRQPHLK